MKIIENEIPYLVGAKTCGCNNKGKNVSYHFIESTHSLCWDKRELLLGQIQVCERLLKYSNDESDNIILQDEINRLRLALNMVQY